MNDALSEVKYTSESQMKSPQALFAAMFRDLRASRELAWQLLVRDIKARYRQSFLGYVWAFLPPLFSSLPFIILNQSKVFSGGDISIPYPAYAMIGTTLWQLFADSVNGPLKAVGQSKQMLVKINFPREAILLANFGTIFFDFMIRLLIIIGVFVAFQLPVPATIFLFPVGILGLALLGGMIGILLTPVGVLYQDVQKSLSMILGLWMLLTPVVYAPDKEGILGVLANWNPVSPVLVTARDWLIGAPPEAAGAFAAVTLGALALMAAGWFLFRISLPHLIARLGN